MKKKELTIGIESQINVDSSCFTCSVFFLQISGAAEDEFTTTNQVGSLVSYECFNLNSIYFP